MGAQRGRDRAVVVEDRARVVVGHLELVAVDGAPPRPGLWNLYLDVNGYWKLLNDWAPALNSVTDGQRVRLNRTVTIDVPRGRGASLLVAGRECDEPSQQVVNGEVVPIVRPAHAPFAV